MTTLLEQDYCVKLNRLKEVAFQMDDTRFSKKEELSVLFFRETCLIPLECDFFETIQFYVVIFF